MKKVHKIISPVLIVAFLLASCLCCCVGTLTEAEASVSVSSCHSEEPQQSEPVQESECDCKATFGVLPINDKFVSLSDLAMLNYIDFTQMRQINNTVVLTPDNIAMYLQGAKPILPFDIPLYLEYSVFRI